MPIPSTPAFRDPAHAWAAPIALPSGSTAIVYCEGQFGEQDGKTANGLVRHSEKYEILSVIDSTHAGADAGMLLDGTANGLPIVSDLVTGIAHAGHVPDYLICGVAPADGLLSAGQRTVLLDGIARGMHIINGLHEFLTDDAEFVAAALLAGVTITDIRRPREKKDLHLFSGRIFDVTCPRIGSRPAGVIVQHAPGRTVLGDFPMVAMPTVDSEIALIEAFADTRVIGVTVNHENLSADQLTAAIDGIEIDTGLPATDPLTRPLGELVDMVLQAFPALTPRPTIRSVV